MSSETTAASNARPVGGGKKSSGRSGRGKRAGASKGGAGKSTATKATGTGKPVGASAEKSAAAETEDYSYVAFHGIDELLLGLQAENSEIYVGEDFVLSNLGEALLISSNADYRTALAEEAQSKFISFIFEYFSRIYANTGTPSISTILRTFSS